MTLIMRSGDRIYADSTHLNTKGPPDRDFLNKVYPLNYIPIYNNGRDPESDDAIPTDYLIGMAYTGDASIGTVIYNTIIEGESIQNLAAMYWRASRLGLGSSRRAIVYFIGCNADYNCQFDGRDTTDPEEYRMRQVNHDSDTYMWMAGSATHVAKRLFENLAAAASAAFLAACDQESDTCGGLIEVWKYTKADESTQTPALFYREGIIQPRTITNLTARTSPHLDIPLDYTVSPQYAEDHAAIARLRWRDIQKKNKVTEIIAQPSPPPVDIREPPATLQATASTPAPLSTPPEAHKPRRKIKPLKR